MSMETGPIPDDQFEDPEKKLTPEQEERKAALIEAAKTDVNVKAKIMSEVSIKRGGNWKRYFERLDEAGGEQ